MLRAGVKTRWNTFSDPLSSAKGFSFVGGASAFSLLGRGREEAEGVEISLRPRTLRPGVLLLVCDWDGGLEESGVGSTNTNGLNWVLRVGYVNIVDMIL